MINERRRRVRELLADCGVADLGNVRILDVGCGSGAWLRDFLSWGASAANLMGLDLLSERIVRAKELGCEGLTIVCGSAHQLPFADSTFDILVQGTVFSSILNGATRRRVAVELVRVLKIGGFIIWYDFSFNNPFNADVRGITKKELIELFAPCRVEAERITVAPPLARLIAPVFPVAYEAIAATRLLSTHYLAAIHKSA
jgi:ubiquinone/menaquinone biosynthesis C-methylase UbiE